MRRPILAGMLLLSGCGRSMNSYQPPHFPELHPRQAEIAEPTCDAKDQPISREAQAHAFALRGEVGLQDIVTIDCDGKTIKKEHAVTKALDLVYTIPPPSGLTKPVHHVTYKNYRTCFTRDLMKSNTPFDLAPEARDLLETANVLHDDGLLQLHLDDSPSKLDFSGVPSRDGINLFEVKYFDGQNALLATQQIETMVHIVPKELGGTKQVKDCAQN